MTLEDIINGLYQKKELLGRGSYGKVYKATCFRTGNLVAMKRPYKVLHLPGMAPHLLRELDIYQRLHGSQYILRVLDVQETICRHGYTTFYIVFECMEGDIGKLVRDIGFKEGIIPIPTIKKMMHQILSGLQHCHTNGVLHRDLKPGNIMYGRDDYNIKIADFGLSRTYFDPNRSAYSPNVVTAWYRPPELLLGMAYYDYSVDIWSAGCIFAELYRLLPLFQTAYEFQQLLEIFSILGTPNENIWPGVTTSKYWIEFPIWEPKYDSFPIIFPRMSNAARDLLLRMLTYDPSRRITVREALRHPFFTNQDDG